MKSMVYFLIMLIVLQPSCGKSREDAEQARKLAEMEANGIAKIKVDERGDIYLNNKLTSLDALSQEMARIKGINGIVWYYRGSSNSAAVTSGMLITDKIVEYQLPVKVCFGDHPCKKDFE